MRVHASLGRPDLVLGKGVRRHGDDGHPGRVLPLQRANRARGLVAAHHRHHHVHEHRVEVARRRSPERVDGLPPVARRLHARPLLLEQELCDLEVQVVVLHEQDAQPVDARRLVRLALVAPRLCRRVHLEGQANRERRPLPLRAHKGNAAAHLVHDALRDGHAEPRARIRGARLGVFLRERLEEVPLELRAHADARVPAGELEGHDAVGERGLAAAQEDLAVLLVVLDRVGDEVHEQPLAVRRATDDAGVRHIAAVLDHLKPALLCLLAHGVEDLARHVAQVERHMLEHDLSALELAHVEHVVYELEQDARGVADLLPALGLLGEVVREALGDVEHARDAVERRADVVAHTQQEVGLRAVGAVGLLLGGDKLALMRLLLLAATTVLGKVLLEHGVDDLEAGDYVALVVELAQAELVIVHDAAVKAAIGALELVAFAKNAPQVRQCEHASNPLAVVGVHALGDPLVDDVLKRESPAHDIGQGVKVVSLAELEDPRRALHDVRHVDVSEVARQAVEDLDLLLKLALVRLFLLALAPIARDGLLDDGVDVLEPADDEVAVGHLEIVVLEAMRLVVDEDMVVAHELFSSLGAERLAQGVEAEGRAERGAVVRMHAVGNVAAEHRLVGEVPGIVAVEPLGNVAVELEHLRRAGRKVNPEHVLEVARQGIEHRGHRVVVGTGTVGVRGGVYFQ